MAVNDTELSNNGTQILFADHGTDFASGAPATAANSLIIGNPLDVQIDLTSLAAAGGGRHSAKTGDLGANRPPLYRVDACVEFATAPAEGETVDFYWAGSPSPTAGVGNPGGVTGSDAAYTDTSGSLAQLAYIGSLVTTTGTLAIGLVGFCQPTHRYGSLVVINNSAADALAASMDETHITFTPVTYNPQTA